MIADEVAEFAVHKGRYGGRRILALTSEDERLLETAKMLGLARRDAIADEQSARTGLPAASTRAYLHHAIEYAFGDDERRGLERFYA